MEDCMVSASGHERDNKVSIHKPQQLAYLSLGTTDMEAWKRLLFILGCHISTDTDNMLRAAIDDRDYRIAVRKADFDDIETLGWEFSNVAELESVVNRLRVSGHDPQVISEPSEYE